MNAGHGRAVSSGVMAYAGRAPARTRKLPWRISVNVSLSWVGRYSSQSGWEKTSLISSGVPTDTNAGHGQLASRVDRVYAVRVLTGIIQSLPGGKLLPGITSTRRSPVSA